MWVLGSRDFKDENLGNGDQVRERVFMLVQVEEAFWSNPVGTSTKVVAAYATYEGRGATGDEEGQQK